MTEMIYEYDGSFEGLLTCVFESYAQKEVLTAITCGEDIQSTLFPVRTVLTDRDPRRPGVPEGGQAVSGGGGPAAPWFSHLPAGAGDPPVPAGGEAAGGGAPVPPGPVRRDAVSGPAGGAAPERRGPSVQGLRPLLRPGGRSGWGDRAEKPGAAPAAAALLRPVPERAVLPLRPHPTGRRCSTPRAAPPSGPWSSSRWRRRTRRRARYRLLWKRFYDTIAIRERENPRCRMTHMPKRYWNTMTEFQGEDSFKARERPAAVSGPGAPAGIPAPGTPPGSGRSAPGSAP